MGSITNYAENSGYSKPSNYARFYQISSIGNQVKITHPYTIYLYS